MKTNCATFKIETRFDCLYLGYDPVCVTLTMETKVDEIYANTMFCSSNCYGMTEWFMMCVDNNPLRTIDDGVLL